MTAGREAIALPLLFLTSTLLASAQPGTPVAFTPPTPFSLVLATMVVAALVRSAALDPSRLLHGSRPILAAAAAVLTIVTPQSGLPRFFVLLFLPVLLANTLVARPDRVRLLRSLAVILGSGVVIKFVVLAGLSEPASSATGRVLVALFDAATFGSLAQQPQAGSAGYFAIAAAGLFLAGAALLPPARSPVAAALAMQHREV
jgi:hypothetical protein